MTTTMDDPNSTNPYASPKVASELVVSSDAIAGSISRGGLWWILFSFQGRMPRRLYWGGFLGATILAVVAAVALIVVFGQESEVTELSVIVIQLVSVWISFALDAKRWHDRDKSAAWFLIRLIPLVG